MPSILLISVVVRPPSAANSTARRCSTGSASSAGRNLRMVSPCSAAAGGSSPITGGSSAIRSMGSIGSGRRTRTASIATFRVIVKSHVVTDPRRGSKLAPWRHARSNASCATSSAAARSFVIVHASPYTWRWNRRTNTAAPSRSPSTSAVSSASSESRSSRPGSNTTLQCTGRTIERIAPFAWYHGADVGHVLLF